MAQGHSVLSGRGWVLALGLGGLLSGLAGCAQEVTAPEVEAHAQGLVAPVGQRITLKACSTRQLVSADQNLANTPLVANRASAQEWEQFQVEDAGGGLVSMGRSSRRRTSSGSSTASW